MSEDVMRAFVIEEKNLQLVGERVEPALVERDDWHAVDDPRVRDITQIIHMDRANGLAAEVAAGEFLPADLDASLQSLARALLRKSGGGECTPTYGS
jgi:hypothetical protein